VFIYIKNIYYLNIFLNKNILNKHQLPQSQCQQLPNPVASMLLCLIAYLISPSLHVIIPKDRILTWTKTWNYTDVIITLHTATMNLIGVRVSTERGQKQSSLKSFETPSQCNWWFSRTTRVLDWQCR